MRPTLLPHLKFSSPIRSITMATSVIRPASHTTAKVHAAIARGKPDWDDGLLLQVFFFDFRGVKHSAISWRTFSKNCHRAEALQEKKLNYHRAMIVIIQIECFPTNMSQPMIFFWAMLCHIWDLKKMAKMNFYEFDEEQVQLSSWVQDRIRILPAWFYRDQYCNL